MNLTFLLRSCRLEDLIGDGLISDQADFPITAVAM